VNIIIILLNFIKNNLKYMLKYFIKYILYFKTYIVSQKRVHLRYNFVNSWSICKIISLIGILLDIYCSLQQWKNFANRSRIDKVIAMVRVAPFFDSRCICRTDLVPSRCLAFLRPAFSRSIRRVFIMSFNSLFERSVNPYIYGAADTSPFGTE